MRPQFGSAPAMAVFTSGLSAIVLPILQRVLPRAAAVHFDRDQVRGAFAVGRNRLGEVFADFEERRAEVVEAFAGKRSSAPAGSRPRRWRAGSPCRSCSCGRRR